jgi:hypothetical protein
LLSRQDLAAATGFAREGASNVRPFLPLHKYNEEAKSELRRMQTERETERAAIAASAAAGSGLGGLLQKEVDFETVKRAVKRLFL